MNAKLEQEVRKLMLQEEKDLPEANEQWMKQKIELFSNEEVFDGLAKCAGYVKKEEIIKIKPHLKKRFNELDKDYAKITKTSLRGIKTKLNGTFKK